MNFYSSTNRLKNFERAMITFLDGRLQNRPFFGRGGGRLGTNRPELRDSISASSVDIPIDIITIKTVLLLVELI